MSLFVVGKSMTPEAPQGEVVSEFQGVFSTLEGATDACKGHPLYYVLGPFTLDELLPDETIEAPIAFYPEDGL